VEDERSPERDLLVPWFQHCGGERPRRPRRSDASAWEYAASWHHRTGSAQLTPRLAKRRCRIRVYY